MQIFGRRSARIAGCGDNMSNIKIYTILFVLILAKYGACLLASYGLEHLNKVTVSEDMQSLLKSRI